MIARTLGILALTVAGCAKETGRAGQPDGAHAAADAAAVVAAPAVAAAPVPEPEPEPEPEPAAAETPSDDALDRDEIAETLDAVKPQVVKCMQVAPELGSARYVQVSIRVGASGSVAFVKMKDPALEKTALETCMTKAIKKARFRRTKTGATVSYPFRLP